MLVVEIIVGTLSEKFQMDSELTLNPALQSDVVKKQKYHC